MNIHIPSTPLKPGYTHIADLKYLSFARLVFDDSCRSYSTTSGDREVSIDVLSGQCTVKTASGALQGEARSGTFEAAPVMFYIPPSTDYTVECAAGTAVAVIFSAPGGANSQPATVIQSSEATLNKVGKDNWFREVYSSIGTNINADKLLVGETTNPPGNWSSAPPHKHDQFSPPKEAPMEEIYYFQVQPKQGFGFMRLYTHPGAEEPFDELMLIRDGDTVLIPRGYHTVAAAPGYKVNYVWALAGEKRTYGAWADDPDHAWLRNT